ncbi:MAG: Carboxylesterase, partial [Gammaproteobacteria bacterium]|nr:Carboxylesterase [Gammaproteobacteria bacterium]
PWSGVRDAVEFGSIAPQASPDPSIGGPWHIIVPQLLPRPNPAAPPPRPKEDEDCLFLNVWTAGLNDGRRRPVMVWLHGGFFAVGSGASVNGTRLANRGDVVVVSINHRLNIFGYCHLGDLGGKEFAHSGNVGMLDIIAALEWVRDNIERFGGDPRKVMIFGESGGGMKTSMLMASPPAQGLFHRAGVQSGPGLAMMERDTATHVSERVLAHLGTGADAIRKLQEMPVSQLLTAFFAVQTELPPRTFTDLPCFAPVLDPHVLPRQPFAPGATPLSAHIPLLIGWNQTEMTFFMGADGAGFSLDGPGLAARLDGLLGTGAARMLAVYRKVYPAYSPSDLYIQIWSDYSIMDATLQQAQRKAALPGASTYLYRFDRRTPVLNGKLRTPHTLENAFVFDDVEGAKFMTGGGEAAAQLARKVSTAWVSFAASGNPNSNESGLPHWPPFETVRRPTMLLDDSSAVVNDPTHQERSVLTEVLRGSSAG